jgi:hypothetical protein
VEPRRHEVDVARDRPRLGLAALRGEAHQRQIAVRGETHVIQLDLVEAGLRGRLGHREVVVPRAAVPRIEPAEAGARLPHGAARRLDREVGTRRREDRILERDDASDQVDAVPVGELNRVLRVVVGPGRADRPRQLRGAPHEADLAGLVLDVELERVETGQAQVLLEPPWERRKGLGDVDSAQLGRDGALHDPHRLRNDPGPRCLSRSRHRAGRAAAKAQGPDSCSKGAGEQPQHAETATADPAAALLPPEPPELVLIGTHWGPQT